MDVSALDLPGPSRRITIEPLRLPDPVVAPPPEPEPEREDAPEQPLREPAPA